MFRVIMTIHEWILTADIIRWTDQTELPIDWRWWDFLIFTRCKSLLVRPAWNLCLMSLNHLLLVVNASVNFLIYCSIGRKFKGGPTVMRLNFELSFQWSPEKYFAENQSLLLRKSPVAGLAHLSAGKPWWWERMRWCWLRWRRSSSCRPALLTLQPSHAWITRKQTKQTKQTLV